MEMNIAYNSKYGEDRVFYPIHRCAEGNVICIVYSFNYHKYYMTIRNESYLQDNCIKNPTNNKFFENIFAERLTI